MKKIVVFSGAGMSAESGISTFRDSNGLWENYKIEEVATPQAWKANPSKVQEFYNMRRKEILNVVPNPAHQLIAQLEAIHKVVIITQNIDDLHERAGSTEVHHLHGNIRLAKSSGPHSEKKYYPIEGDSLRLDNDFCDDGYPLRPHVVWFGEEVPMYEKVIPHIETAEIFIVIGTSLNVFPAAGLIHYCNPNAEKILIDPNAESLKTSSDYTIYPLRAIAGMEKVYNKILKRE